MNQGRASSILSPCYLLLATLCALAHAKAPERDVEIAAGNATAALRQLAEQTSLQILFEPQILEGVTTSSVSGHMDGIGALRQMLEGSGLAVAQINPSTISIVRAQTAPTLGQSAPASSIEDSPPARSGQIVENSRGVPEILIRGSRTLNAELKRSENDVQPYVVFDAEKIQRSGASDLQSFLRQRLTANWALASNSQSATGVGNATSFNLRGLDTDETLILVNGRRLASFGFSGRPQQPDIGGIPLAAIERIEVLASTASGIFGGGATGGVVNVVLKQSYNGIGLATSFENTFSATAPRRDVNLNLGFSPSGGKTSIMLSGAYSETNTLYVADRDYQRAARALAIQNDPAGFYNALSPPLGATTNIRSTTGVPLRLKTAYGGALLPSSFTSVPYGYAGVTSDNGAALVANAGSYNLDLADTSQASGARRALLNAPTKKSFSTSARHQFTERLDAFAEFAVSENSGSFQADSNTGVFILQPTAQANPFQQPIRITVPIAGRESQNESEILSRRAIAGISLRLASDWHAEVEYSWSSTRFESMGVSALPAAASNAVSTGEINLIRDTNAFPADYSSFPIQQSGSLPSTTKLKNPAVRFGGSIPLMLPGGRPSLAALLEYRRLEMDDYYQLSSGSKSVFPSRWQSTKSVYLESRLPLISEANERPGARLLEIQLAGRNDWYITEAANAFVLSSNTPPVVRSRGTLSSLDPTAGLRYQPLRGLMVRASFATGFIPPTVNQLVPDAPRDTVAGSLTDPRRGNEPLTGRTISNQFGGNPDLEPEEARTWAFGLVLTPVFAPGLRVSIDRTQIEKKNNIEQVINQTLIDNELFLPGRVTRAAPTPQNDPRGFGVGPIIGLDQRLVNVSKVDVEAWDIAVDYEFPTTRLGQVELSLRGTRTIHNKAQLSPASSAAERVGLLDGNLRWGANAALTWDYRDWSLGWQTQYFDKYWLRPDRQVDSFQASATVPSQIYHDVFLRYGSENGEQGGVWGAALLKGLSVQIGVQNVMNTRPPIVASHANGYSGIADPRRARYYISLQKNF